MIWPLWVALAFALALACRGSARRGLFIVAGGLLAMQALALAPPDLRYLGAGALWVAIGGDAIRRQHATSGCLLVLSGLCYFAAQVFAAPWELFVPPLLAADAFGVAAVAGYWYAGRPSRLDHLGDVGGRDRRRPDRAGAGVADAAQAQITLTERY